jgi:hypothetical protein
MHVDSAFQVSTGMKVTCSSAVGEVTDILEVFSNHVYYNTQAACISGFELPLCCSSESKFFGKFVDPSHRVYM